MSMTISTFNLDDIDLATVRQCAGDNAVVPYSCLEAIDSVNDSCLLIGDFRLAGFTPCELQDRIAKNPLLVHTQILLILDDQDIENHFSSDAWPNIDFYRRPIVENSLRTRIMLHAELIRAKNCAREKHEQAALFEAMFSQSPIGMLLTHDGTAVAEESWDHFSMNPMVEKIMGRSEYELRQLSLADVTHPEDLHSELEKLQQLNAGEIDRYAMDKRYILPDGSTTWVHIVVAPISIPDDQRPLQICFIFDIMRRKQLEQALLESERSKSVLLSHLPGMAYRCDNDPLWTMRFVSAGCLGLTGYDPEDFINNRKISFNQVIAPEYRDKLRKGWSRVLAKRRPFKEEYEIITAEGSRKWVMEAAQGIYDPNGTVVALEGIILDITNRKRIEQKLIHYSEHDHWTGLYNRHAFERMLRLESRLRGNAKRAIIGINLSTIHTLTLTYGFDYGQRVVHRIAEEFKRLSDDKHELFNTYVNRFVFYVRDYQEKADLVRFCREISRRLKTILTIERIGWGIGIIELGKFSARDINTILRNLLVASEKALAGFEDDLDCIFFDSQMELDIEREKIITQELIEIAAGTDEERLYLQFQPIVDLRSNAICGFEALARLHSRNLGLISPLEFIPITERTKLIIPLGFKILHQAFLFKKRLWEAGYDCISISINISPIQLLRKDFLPNLTGMMERLDVTPQLISFEITESVFSSKLQEVNRILAQLRHLGFHIALDDFGTGYSSFARERELNINCLKIDKFFIDKLMYLNDDEAITGDIISMGHKLGHCIVAEGVEHEKQREYLMRHDCDKMQGYLFSKPVDAPEAMELLKTSKCSKSACNDCS